MPRPSSTELTPHFHHVCVQTSLCQSGPLWSHLLKQHPPCWPTQPHYSICLTQCFAASQSAYHHGYSTYLLSISLYQKHNSCKKDFVALSPAPWTEANIHQVRSKYLTTVLAWNMEFSQKAEETKLKMDKFNKGVMRKGMTFCVILYKESSKHIKQLLRWTFTLSWASRESYSSKQLLKVKNRKTYTMQKH